MAEEFTDEIRLVKKFDEKFDNVFRRIEDGSAEFKPRRKVRADIYKMFFGE